MAIKVHKPLGMTSGASYRNKNRDTSVPLFLYCNVTRMDFIFLP